MIIKPYVYFGKYLKASVSIDTISKEESLGDEWLEDTIFIAVMEILNCETPICEDLLIKRILDAFGLGHNVKVISKVKDVLHGMALSTTKSFDGSVVFWRSNEEHDTFNGFRDGNWGSRAPRYIPLQELLNAIGFVLQEETGITRQSLSRKVIQTLQYPLNSKEAESVVLKGIEMGQSLKMLEYKGDHVFLNEDSSIELGQEFQADESQADESNQIFWQPEEYKREENEDQKRKRFFNRDYSTSLPEQGLYYYIHQFFDDALNRAVISSNSNSSIGYEADIYIPSIKVAIEYDGLAWHADKRSDQKKNKHFNSLGIFVIRVRETGLPELEPFHGKIVEAKLHNKWPLNYNYVAETMHMLADFAKDEPRHSSLKEFCLTDNQYNETIPLFAGNLFTGPAELNITNSCAFPFWNYDKNGELNPENVPLKSLMWVWVKCHTNKEFMVPVNRLPDKTKCMHDCQECKNSVCALLNICREECEYLDTQYDAFVDGQSVRSIEFLKYHLKYSNKPWEYVHKLATEGFTNSQKNRCETLLFQTIDLNNYKGIIPTNIEEFKLRTIDPGIDYGKYVQNQNDLEILKQMIIKYPYSSFCVHLSDRLSHNKDYIESLLSYYHYALMHTKRPQWMFMEPYYWRDADSMMGLKNVFYDKKVVARIKRIIGRNDIDSIYSYRFR